MTKEELDTEIEYIHSNRTDERLLRSFDVMFEVIVEATDTYTNILLFMNDYIKLFNSKKIDEKTYNSAMNDLYLLALLHTSTDEYGCKLWI